MSKVLVIGGGPAGCMITHFLIGNGYDVTVVEKAGTLGGGGRTHYYGGHPYTFGPRHFLTKREDVWNYFNKFCPLKRYDGHEFLTYIERDQAFYHFPIHNDEIDQMPDAGRIRRELAVAPGGKDAKTLEEYWTFSVGPTLYEKFVKNYSAKMWQGISNNKITDFGWSPKGVSIKTGPIKGAWSEAFTGFPLAKDGYDDYWPLAVQGANVFTYSVTQEFDIQRKRVKIDGSWTEWDIIVSTISPEYLYQLCFGPLRWMGRDFFPIVLPVREALPPTIFFLYYANKEPFTRIVEYKKFYEWDKDSPTTLLGLEVPSTRNHLYPYPTTEDQAKAQKYLDLLPQDVYSIGRMGSYRYLDFGMIIEQCFDLITKIKGPGACVFS